MADAFDTFSERAPLVSRGELARIVRGELIGFDSPLLDAVASIWVYGSFVDSDATLDAAGRVSDLDVYVVLGEWDQRAPAATAELSTRFSATQHGLLCRCALHGVFDVYGREGPVSVSLPTHAFEDGPALTATLRRAELSVVHLRETDQELLQFRPLDVTIGGRETFEAFVGDAPRLRVWPPGTADAVTVAGP